MNIINISTDECNLIIKHLVEAGVIDQNNIAEEQLIKFVEILKENINK